MTLDELSKKLNETFLNAPDGKRVTMIILFGIQYCDYLEQVGASNVVEQSGINTKYYGEIRKGMNLSKYVGLLKSSESSIKHALGKIDPLHILF